MQAGATHEQISASSSAMHHAPPLPKSILLHSSPAGKHTRRDTRWRKTELVLSFAIACKCLSWTKALHGERPVPGQTKISGTLNGGKDKAPRSRPQSSGASKGARCRKLLQRPWPFGLCGGPATWDGAESATTSRSTRCLRRWSSRIRPQSGRGCPELSRTIPDQFCSISIDFARSLLCVLPQIWRLNRPNVGRIRPKLGRGSG